MREVITPSGISSAEIERARSSTSSRKEAPVKNAAGSSRLCSGPTIKRARCGIISPTQPMIPVTATTEAVSNEALQIMTRRKE